MIVGHSRNIENSFHKSDDRRKIERESRKERKEKERRQKEAELRRLKNVKRAEIKERLKKINSIGCTEFVSESLLDDDWDAAKYEAEMAAQFGDDYYDAAEKDTDMPLQHPAELEGWDDDDYYEEIGLAEESEAHLKKGKKGKKKNITEDSVDAEAEEE